MTMTLGWRSKLPCDIVMDNDDRREIDEIVNELNTHLSYDLRWGPVPEPRSDEISCDQVFPNLFLGGAVAAKSKKYLKRTGVTHVVNTAMGDSFGLVDVDSSYYSGMKISFLGFKIMDMANVNISQYFDESADFIDRALNSGGKVLVHCVMGISRSATIVCAFLMLKRGFSAVEALKLVRSRRLVHPNYGFIRKLAALDLKLRKERENRDRLHRVILWGRRDRPNSCDRLSGSDRLSSYDRRSSYDQLCGYDRPISSDHLRSNYRSYGNDRDSGNNRPYGHGIISSYDRFRPVREGLYSSSLTRHDDIGHRLRWTGSLPTSYLMSLHRSY